MSAQTAPPDLVDVVGRALGIDPAGLTDGDGPATIGAWSSRRHLELMVSVERAYGVAFGYREMVRTRTLGDLRAALVGRGVLP